MKLVSMTDFVLEQLSIKQSASEFKEMVRDYADFLKRPLTLGMFVPCDELGNPIELPLHPIVDNIIEEGIHAKHKEKINKYQQAKERVLFTFDGGVNVIRNKENLFIIEDKNGVYYRVLKNRTRTNIESLFKFSVDIELTETVIKQLQL